jgi:hypothetical protein
MKAYYQYCFYNEETGSYVVSEYPPDPGYKSVSRVGVHIIADMASNPDYFYPLHPDVGQIIVDYEERKVRVIEVQHLKIKKIKEGSTSSS